MVFQVSSITPIMLIMILPYAPYKGWSTKGNVIMIS